MPGFLAEVLTWGHNFQYTLAVETAMELHLPPTVFIIPDRQPTDGWSDADKKLALAWTILKKETCGKCGQPLWICRSNNKNLSFKIRTDICYASMALEKWQESSRGKKLKKGESPYIVPSMYREDEKLPTRRDYQKQLEED